MGFGGGSEQVSKCIESLKQSHGTLGSPVGLLLDRNRQAASALALHCLLACWSNVMIMVVVMKMDRSGRLLCVTPGCTMAPPLPLPTQAREETGRLSGGGSRMASCHGVVFLGICLFAANSGLRAQQRQAAGPPQCDWPRRLDRARAGLPRPATRANSELVKTPSDLFLHARLAFLNPASCSQLPVPDSPPSTCPSCSSPSANPLRPKTNARTAIVARRSHFWPGRKRKKKKKSRLVFHPPQNQRPRRPSRTSPSDTIPSPSQPAPVSTNPNSIPKYRYHVRHQDSPPGCCARRAHPFHSLPRQAHNSWYVHHVPLSLCGAHWTPRRTPSPHPYTHLGFQAP